MNIICLEHLNLAFPFTCLNLFSRQILRPTVVSTVILTDRETSTVTQTVSKPIFAGPDSFNARQGIPTTSEDLVREQQNLFLSDQAELITKALKISDDFDSRQVFEYLERIQQDFDRIISNSQPAAVKLTSITELLHRQVNLRKLIAKFLSK